jgi:hypothetical protein
VSWVASNAGEEGVGKYSREYTYDKVGNRLSMTLVDEDGVVSRDEDWTMEYNDLNQLDRRYDGASWSGADGDARWDYTYDDNGNLTQAKKEAKASGVWSETLKWVYEWNPRDQMTSKSFGPRLFNHSCQIPKTRTNRDKE